MKKVIINGKFYSAALEGMPRVGRELTAAIDILLDTVDVKGLQFQLIAPSKIELPEFRNIEVIRTKMLKGALWEQLAFAFHARGGYSVNFTNTAPLLLKNGLVVIHDAQFRSVPNSHRWKSRFLYNFVSPVVGRNYTDIVTVSQYAKGELREFNVCVREDVQVIWNGADHVFRWSSDEAVLNKFALLPKGYYLSNSYVHSHKNVAVLLKAASSSQDFAKKLVLFGSSSAQDHIARGTHVPPEVRFLGRVTDAELAALMKNASIFLFPSRTEGFGLPPLEAMALGCPTICSRSGAMPEVCASGASYADADDCYSWLAEVDRIESKASNRELLSRRAVMRSSEFIWAEAAKRYLAIILRSCLR